MATYPVTNLASGADITSTWTNAIYQNIGSAAWTSWTPTFNAGCTQVANNGVWAAGYKEIGSLVVWRMKFTYGTTTTPGTVKIDLPKTNSGVSNQGITGFAWDASATTRFMLAGVYFDTATFDLEALTATTTYVQHLALSATVPFTFTSTDYFIVSGFYEQA